MITARCELYLRTATLFVRFSSFFYKDTSWIQGLS